MSDTFCPIPWVHVATMTNGDFRVCCEQDRGEYGRSRKESGEFYNINSDSIESFRNSPGVVKLRQNLLSGIKASECEKCWGKEAYGIESNRQVWLRKNSQIKPDQCTSSPLPLKELDLRLGNKCNLKCHTCSFDSSHSWEDDWVRMRLEDEHLTRVKFPNRHSPAEFELRNGKWYSTDQRYKWPENEWSQRQLKEALVGVKKIYFAGGEPLISPYHWQIVEKFVSEGSAPDVELEYNTNLTNFQADKWKLWSHFKNVKVMVSVDAYGKVNEYMRYPSNWQKVCANLKKLDQLGGPVGGHLTPTWSIFNFLEVFKLAQWVVEQNFIHLDPLIYVELLRNPPVYALQQLNTNLKNKIVHRWELFKEWLQHNNPHLAHEYSRLFEPMIQRILKEQSHFSGQDFYDRVRKLDQIRQQDVFDFVPELREWVFE